MQTISPTTVAPVCGVGDPLNLICTASIQFISWSVLRVNEQGILERVFFDEPLNSEDLLQMPQPIVNSLATFTFSRTSAQAELPLITMLSIDSVSIGLNGTVVNCMDGRSQLQEENKLIPASTIIQIIDTTQSELTYQLSQIFLRLSYPIINRRSIDIGLERSTNTLRSC
jgi:hypothetical protein